MIKYVYILCSVLLLSACNEYALQDTVMVYDSEHPNLPEYSEWGYNTFGAYYDREIFKSNTSIIPAKFIITNNTMTFLLSGQKGTSNYDSYYDNRYENSRDMSIAFTLKGFEPQSFVDLTMLHDTIIDLTDTAHSVKITIDSVEYVAQILSGELNCKRVQMLYVDTELTEAILSGFFDFKALVNNIPITIANGRFDVGVSTHNFYVY